MNVNNFIFTRTQPKKKLEVIEKLSNDELLAVSEATVKKIIQEVGQRRYKSRDKQLTINRELQAGNQWNSTIDGVELIKGKLHVSIYVQYSNTDTNTSEAFDEFFNRWNTYRGEIRRLDVRGNGRSYYFNYDLSDKAHVMKSVLLQYVHNKYADKLKEA